MIQRIQTVFLLLSVACLALFLWMPLIGLEPANFPPLKGWEVTEKFPFNGDYYIYFINAMLTGTAIAITLINIFLFRKRNTQMLLCWFSIVFIASAAGFVYYEYQTKIFFGDVILTSWNLLAIGAAAFQILAFIFIRKDEELIKSADRLR